MTYNILNRNTEMTESIFKQNVSGHKHKLQNNTYKDRSSKNSFFLRESRRNGTNKGQERSKVMRAFKKVYDKEVELKSGHST